MTVSAKIIDPRTEFTVLDTSRLGDANVVPNNTCFLFRSSLACPIKLISSQTRYLYDIFGVEPLDYNSGPVFVLALPGGKICNKVGDKNRYTLLTNDNRWVNGYNSDYYGYPPKAPRTWWTYKDDFLLDDREYEHIDERCFLLLGGQNYFRWTFELLASLYQWRLLPSPKPKIAVGKLNRAQLESLSSAGISDEHIIFLKDETNYSFKRLFVSSFRSISGAGTYNCPETRILLEEISGKVADSLFNKPEYVYISRGDAAYRRVTNEYDLVHELKNRGFTDIKAGTMGYLEQVATFSRAKIIIGLHGAGLTNMIYARPGAVVIELMPRSLGNNNFHKLATIKGHPYYSITVNSDGASDINRGDVSIDIKEIISLVEKAQSLIANR